jgi:biopolymer transport protein ExbD
MAGIAVGEGGRRGRKSLDAELNMVPMIDLLMVTIAFLLVTAVWSHMSRMEGSAEVPGSAEWNCPPVPAMALHVDMRAADKFVLSWQEGQKVVRSVDVPRDAAALARAVEREWRTSGVHTSPTDAQRDKAVLHTANDAPFADMVAVMDAIEATRRPLARSRVPVGQSAGLRPDLRGDSAAVALTLATQ